MAFASTITGKVVMGNKVKTWGTFASSGDSEGGDIETGLHICEHLVLSQKGVAITTGAPVINETFPVVKTTSQSSAQVTIVTDANVTGTWEAIGKGY